MDITRGIRRLWAARTQSRKAARSASLEAEAEQLIQAKEFGGKLYVAFGGDPIICAEDLTRPLPQALNEARETWIQYCLRRGRRLR